MSSDSDFDSLVDNDDNGDSNRSNRSTNTSADSASQEDAQATEGSRSGHSRSATASGTEDEDLSNTSASFGFNDAIQTPVYPRDETWNEVDDLKFEARSRLRRRFNIKNVSQRELDEALFELALERLDGEMLAEKVAEDRRR